MNITIKTSKGQMYTVEMANDEENVSALKSKLSSQISIPQEKIRLIYAGKLLKDDQTLKSYSLTDSSTVHLVIPGVEKKASPVSPSSTGAQSAPVDTSAASTPLGNDNKTGTPNSAGGGLDPNILQALSANMGGMWGNNSSSAGGAGGAGPIDNKIMEMLKNPEIIKAFLEAYLPTQNNFPGTKEAAMENLQKLIEMYKSNPEQYNSLLNYATNNPDLLKIMGNSPFGSHIPQQGGAPSSNAASSNASDGFITYGMPPFDKKAAMEKYADKLTELEVIGYTNKEMNLIALVYTDGDLTKAVNLLLDWSNDQ